MDNSTDAVYEAVRQWGYSTGILREFDNYGELQQVRKAQALKTLEEVQELFHAIDVDDLDLVRDSIGDIIVTLCMQAELWETSPQTCLYDALQIISKRSGKMVNGQFVKDGD